MEKFKLAGILCLLFLVLPNLRAQISHGGEPLPLSSLRSYEEIPFVEMPGFDIKEEFRIDSLTAGDLRNGFRFAYKFLTDLNRGNSGTSFILPDGTKVWRLGIYSPGALSLNVLFSEYELPEGARLFLYDAQQQHVLGAFTHQNNSEREVLPVAPVQGDRLIIEYQEPPKAAFPGRLTIGEVNHAYRTWKGQEPSEGYTSLDGIPALACYADTSAQIQTWGRSVVLMIINGTTACTGTLLNNTARDGKPYLLTASHCLNKSFSISNPDYEEIAGSIVCFYNYNSPLCDPILRGTEELSTASAHSRAVYEFTDMALLELNELPPAYYQPYLAGWDASGKGSAPYACIQHPQYSTKRISLSEGNLSAYSLVDVIPFYSEAHWLVDEWSIGYTAGGSSGSPLFDKTGKVVGALSGGKSSLASPRNDYFYSLQKSWDLREADNQQLKCWLAPGNSKETSCEGMDPYASAPCFRLSNVGDSGVKDSIEMTEKNDVPVFGYYPSEGKEYAEEYAATGTALLYGAYLVSPPCDNSLEVEITVYAGEDAPSTLLYKETFKPTYLNWSDGSFLESAKKLDRAQEHFIAFASPVSVSGKFYVGYRVKQAAEGKYFAAYNLPRGRVSGNTAWVRDGGRWLQANEYAEIGFNTALFIDPVVNYEGITANESLPSPEFVRIVQSRDRQWLYIHPVAADLEGNARYQIFSAGGQLVKSGRIDGITSVPLAELAPGIYLVRVNSKTTQATRKIVR